ncbi:hypothetical protein HK104_007408, partial [Borealophlyctis nickersoniae]
MDMQSEMGEVPGRMVGVVERKLGRLAGVDGRVVVFGMCLVEKCGDLDVEGFARVVGVEDVEAVRKVVGGAGDIRENATKLYNARIGFNPSFLIPTLNLHLSLRCLDILFTYFLSLPSKAATTPITNASQLPTNVRYAASHWVTHWERSVAAGDGLVCEEDVKEREEMGRRVRELMGEWGVHYLEVVRGLEESGVEGALKRLREWAQAGYPDTHEFLTTPGITHADIRTFFQTTQSYQSTFSDLYYDPSLSPHLFRAALPLASILFTAPDETLTFPYLHRTLTIFCFKTMIENLHFNMCNLDTTSPDAPGDWTDGDVVASHVPAELMYVAQQWTHHLENA